MIIKTPTYGPTRIYKDIDYNFGLHPDTHDVSKRTDTNAIKQAIITLVNTRMGERLFQPNVGSLVGNLLFENLDTVIATTMRQSIEQCIQNYEPRAIVQSIVVSSDYDSNSIDVTITYIPLGLSTSTSFTLTLNRLR